MKAPLKRKWAAALRSGEYQQGYHHLEYCDTYCCLGVLCSIAGGRKYRDARRGTLTAAERDRWGLSRVQMVELIDMNDEQGKSFQQIANYIEKNL